MWSHRFKMWPICDETAASERFLLFAAVAAFERFCRFATEPVIVTETAF